MRAHLWPSRALCSPCQQGQSGARPHEPRCIRAPRRAELQTATREEITSPAGCSFAARGPVAARCRLRCTRAGPTAPCALPARIWTAYRPCI